MTKDLLLVTKLDYILPVDLYDTTGDDDIHINVLWNDIVSDMKQNCECNEYCTQHVYSCIQLELKKSKGYRFA